MPSVIPSLKFLSHKLDSVSSPPFSLLPTLGHMVALVSLAFWMNFYLRAFALAVQPLPRPRVGHVALILTGHCLNTAARAGS